MASPRPGIWVMAAGVFLAVTGGASYAACAPENPIMSAPPTCTGLADLIFIGVLLTVLGAVLAGVGYAFRSGPTPVRSGVIHRPPLPAGPLPAPSPRGALPENLVSRPPAITAEVRCPYCDHSRPAGGDGCPVCGAWSSSAPAPTPRRSAARGP